MRARARLWLGGVGLLGGLAAAWAWWPRPAAEDDLARRLAQLATPVAGELRPCTTAPGAGLALLALGQSNAGNHAGKYAETGPTPAAGPGLTVFDGAGCRRAGDPLPFATGRGGSIWSQLAPALAATGRPREVLLSLLAVESTRIDDWTRPGSPLRARLDSQLAAMARAGLRPRLVLWQQGEADARAGTSAADYLAGLEQLRSQLRAQGLDAPLVLARSTVCRNEGGAPVRAAMADMARRHADVLLGPDTDTLRGDHRIDDCHFSADGAAAAAALWAQTLGPLVD